MLTWGMQYPSRGDVWKRVEEIISGIGNPYDVATWNFILTATGLKAIDFQYDGNDGLSWSEERKNNLRSRILEEAKC